MTKQILKRKVSSIKQPKLQIIGNNIYSKDIVTEISDTFNLFYIVAKALDTLYEHNA